jgi:dihydrolipoamide dehydrogenase
MSASIEVAVPDIGDFDEVEVIELLVKPGDTVMPEQSLITVESDKASMEIPSSAAGVVRELRVKLGDKVSKGSVVLVLEATGAAVDVPQDSEAAAVPAEDAVAAAPPAPAVAPTPAVARAADLSCGVLVLGGGPGGYSAAFRAADLGLSTVIVERYPTLGGVCLNVGCIPSKALLHVAALIDETRGLAAHGVSFGEPAIDLAGLRGWKDKVVGKLTGGLAGMARARKVEVVRGVARFLDAHHVEV